MTEESNKHEIEPLWRLEDIANYISGHKVMAKKVAAQPSFPKAVKMTPNSHKRWIPAEVIAWVESRR